MIILQASSLRPVQRQLPGTPVVALDAAGVPVAMGTTLSTDPAARKGEIAAFTSSALAHSKEVGNYADILSTGLDLAANKMPTYAHPIGEGSAVVSLVATGFSLVNEIDKGNRVKIAIAGFKFGANALAAIDEYVIPGVPALKTTAQVCKLVSAVFSAMPEADTQPATLTFTRPEPA